MIEKGRENGQWYYSGRAWYGKVVQRYRWSTARRTVSGRLCGRGGDK